MAIMAIEQVPLIEKELKAFGPECSEGRVNMDDIPTPEQIKSILNNHIMTILPRAMSIGRAEEILVEMTSLASVRLEDYRKERAATGIKPATLQSDIAL